MTPDHSVWHPSDPFIAKKSFSRDYISLYGEPPACKACGNKINPGDEIIWRKQPKWSPKSGKFVGAGELAHVGCCEEKTAEKISLGGVV